MLYSMWGESQEWLVSRSPIRKRLNPRKATETKLKNIAHNVRRIVYLEIMVALLLIGHIRGNE